MSPKKRRLFTDEQKAEAVRIALASDKSIGYFSPVQFEKLYWVRLSKQNAA